MGKWREEQIGECRLILGDCLEVLTDLPKNCSIVSDVPYGMGWNTDSTRFTGGGQKRGDGRADWGPIHSDDAPFDPSPWLQFKNVVLWGANHFAPRLPLGKTLVWLKKHPGLFGTFLSDAEIGWAKGGHGVYCHYEQFPPPSRIAEGGIGETPHPTVKPLGLMAWCIREFSGDALICDPYMGSGSTLVSCVKSGRSGIGVEIEPRYFDVACRRVEAAHQQADLFVQPAPAPKPVQQSIFDGEAS